jgi:hypothetical protein
MTGSFDVGQVIYVISRKESRVYPVLVVEENVKRTLEGAAVTYMVRLPDKKGTVIQLDTITDRAFTSPVELQDFLISTATRSISAMVAEATEIGKALAPAGDRPAHAPDEQPEEEAVTIEMPDGTRARLRTPNPVQG